MNELRENTVDHMAQAIESMLHTFYPASHQPEEKIGQYRQLWNRLGTLRGEVLDDPSLSDIIRVGKELISISQHRPDYKHDDLHPFNHMPHIDDFLKSLCEESHIAMVELIEDLDPRLANALSNGSLLSPSHLQKVGPHESWARDALLREQEALLSLGSQSSQPDCWDQFDHRHLNIDHSGELSILNYGDLDTEKGIQRLAVINNPTMQNGIREQNDRQLVESARELFFLGSDTQPPGVRLSLPELCNAVESSAKALHAQPSQTVENAEVLEQVIANAQKVREAVTGKKPAIQSPAASLNHTSTPSL